MLPASNLPVKSQAIQLFALLGLPAQSNQREWRSLARSVALAGQANEVAFLRQEFFQLLAENPAPRAINPSQLVNASFASSTSLSAHGISGNPAR